MLIYRKGDGFKYLCRATGSALPGAAIPGLISATFTFALGLLPGDYLDQLLVHPYPFQPFAYIAAFALVFRTNIAMQRFNEANMWTTQMASRWADGIVEILTFDELPRGKPELKDETRAKRRRFQALLLHRMSLLHALALQYLRRDRVLSHLVRASGRSVPHPWIPGRFGTPLSGDEPPIMREQGEWRELEVLGGVTASELAMLESSPDRVNTIFTTVVHLCIQRRGDGGLGVDAPVLSRLYQVLSDGMLGFRQARKLEDIPFPFPYVQAIEIFLITFMFTFPLVLIHFANGAFETFWVGPLFAFITVTAYMAMHRVARALEDPFVHPPNDLPATSLQIAFNGRLLSSFDALRRPADVMPPRGAAAAAAAASTPARPSNGENGGPSEGANGDSPGGVDSPGSDDAQAAEDALWGEYAELEPADVRALTVELLNEWRQVGSPPQFNDAKLKARRPDTIVDDDEFPEPGSEGTSSTKRRPSLTPHQRQVARQRSGDNLLRQRSGELTPKSVALSPL